MMIKQGSVFIIYECATNWTCGVVLHPFNEAAQMKIGAIHATIAQGSHFRIFLTAVYEFEM